MRVAIVQDWLIVNGGAEKVLAQLVALYPYADIFALIDFLKPDDRQQIVQGKYATTSYFQKIPFAKHFYRYFLPLFPHAIESLDLSNYDLIISSSYAVAKGVKKHKNQMHICYCHSPIRYAWDLEDTYLHDVNVLKKWLAKYTLAYIRKWDLKTLNSVDYFIANSKYIQERIQRIYQRDATVIYPPVDLKAFEPNSDKENYYFTTARLVGYKKTDLIVKAFAKLPHLKLVVAGEGPDLDWLKSIATSNVIFTGYLEKAALVTYMQKSKAFVLAAVEDFGISALEAQSCATPVIALRKGGYLETVVENKTGVFFDEQSEEAIAQCIKAFDEGHRHFELIDFAQNVEQYSADVFKQKMAHFIAEKLESNAKF